MAEWLLVYDGPDDPFSFRPQAVWRKLWVCSSCESRVTVAYFKDNVAFNGEPWKPDPHVSCGVPRSDHDL